MPSDIRAALRDSFAIGMGYIPLGFGFGMLVTKYGFAWWWATVSAFFIYAGSVEYLLIVMISSGASLLAIASTTFFVNFRHIFYGLSFPLHLVKPYWLRPYCIFAETDEAYAIITSRPINELTSRRIVITEILCHLFWVAGSTLGAILAYFLPIDTKILSFTLTALFVVLTIDSYKNYPNIKIFILAVACGIFGVVVAPQQILLVSLSVYALILIFRIIYEIKTAPADLKKISIKPITSNVSEDELGRG